MKPRILSLLATAPWLAAAAVAEEAAPAEEAPRVTEEVIAMDIDGSSYPHASVGTPRTLHATYALRL